MTTPTQERSVEEILEELMTLLNEHQGRDPMHDGNFRQAMASFIQQTLQAERQKREEVVEKIIEFTKKRCDERYDAVMGEAFLMRNKGYNDGMRAVETFIKALTPQDESNK